MKNLKDIYSTITSHRSIRKYKADEIPEADLNMILQAAIHAPSSVNGQQWSIIVVKDEKMRDKIADLTGSKNKWRQEWIAQCPVFLVFVMDYYKIGKTLSAKDLDFGHLDSIEAPMTGCVDIGIAFSNAMNVAEAMGYGTVAIGAIRGKAKELIGLLDLPEQTYPILGMCLGKADEQPAMKPRLPFDATVHYEKYNRNTDDLVKDYDKTIKDYLFTRSNGEIDRTWSETLARYYVTGYSPEAKKTMIEQGFKFKF